MTGPRVATASVLVAAGAGAPWPWAEADGEVVERRPDRLTLAYGSVTAAVAGAVAAARAGAAVGLAVGEVSRGEAGWAGPPLDAACALADEAGRGGGKRILATAVVPVLAPLAGVRCVPVGAVEVGAGGPVECVELVLADGGSALGDGTGPGPLEVPLPAVLTIAGAFAFVARAEAEAVLERAWVAASTGGRQVVLVGGAAGTGKTRLVTEFARSAHARGAVVLYGTCSDQASVPYEPFVAALDHLFGALDPEALADVLAGGGPEVARLVPRLARRVGVASPAGAGDPEGERYRLFAAVETALANASRSRPVLLVLDDLHWAGRPTVQLLDHLARSPGLANVCVVATYRSTPAEVGEPLKAALPELRRHAGVTRLALGGFDREGVRHFVQAAAGHAVGASLEPVVEGLADQTDGNAFLLGELWRHLVETGHLVRRREHWEPGRPLADLASPEGVREVVESRLARLPDSTRELLKAAAVVGTSFAVRVLAATVTSDARSVVTTLDPAVRAGLVDESGPGEYRFTHVLVRRALYDGLPIAERRSRHLDVGRALERLHGERAVAAVASHLALAVPVADPAVAVAAARRAASAAVRSVAYDDAARHLEAVLPNASPSRERCDVLLELADVSMRAGDVEAAQGHSLEASALARELGEDDVVVAAALAYEDANWRAALYGRVAERLLREALPLAEDEVTRVRLLAALSRALAFSGRGDEARTLSAEALAAAREVGDYDTLRTALMSVTFLPLTPASLEDHIATAREFVDLARAEGDVEWETYASDKVLYGLVSAGELDEARRVARRRGVLAEQIGQPLPRVLDLQARAMFAVGEGRFAEAEALATEANELARFLSANDVAGGYGVQMFSIRREQGRLEETRPVVEAVARLGQEAATWRPALAVLYAELGLPEQAAGEVGHLVGEGLRAVPRDSLWWASLCYLADACAALGDRDGAAAVYRELLPYRGLVVQVGNYLACYGAADRYLGALAALCGRARDAETHFEAALRIDARAHMPVWLAHTHLAYGRFLASRSRPGDRERAFTLLGAAGTTARELGMAPVAAWASEALDGLGAGAHLAAGGVTTEKGDAAGLTDRERAVLALLAEGRTNREIGERLRISQHTAANHVRAILLKTACANRTEATAWALRRGLATG